MFYQRHAIFRISVRLTKKLTWFPLTVLQLWMFKICASTKIFLCCTYISSFLLVDVLCHFFIQGRNLFSFKIHSRIHSRCMSVCSHVSLISRSVNLSWIPPSCAPLTQYRTCRTVTKQRNFVESGYNAVIKMFYLLNNFIHLNKLTAMFFKLLKCLSYCMYHWMKQFKSKRAVNCLIDILKHV